MIVLTSEEQINTLFHTIVDVNVRRMTMTVDFLIAFKIYFLGICMEIDIEINRSTKRISSNSSSKFS